MPRTRATTFNVDILVDVAPGHVLAVLATIAEAQRTKHWGKV